MSKGTCPEESTIVNVWVAGAGHSTALFVDGSTANWLGPEMLMRLKVEGREVNALAESSSQVNT